VLGLGIIFSVIFKDTYRIIIPTASFQATKTDKKCKHLLNVRAVTWNSDVFILLFSSQWIEGTRGTPYEQGLFTE
jgi:hypothetical protein